MVSKRLLQEAVRLDPNYAAAHIALSYTLARDVWLCASESPQETLTDAMKEAKKAVELDNSSAEAQTALSNVFLLLHQHDKAIEVAQQAVKLNSDSVNPRFFLALALNYTFRCEEALPLFRQVIRFSPFVPAFYLQFAIACRETGRYEEGITAIKKSCSLLPILCLPILFWPLCIVTPSVQMRPRPPPRRSSASTPIFLSSGLPKKSRTRKGREKTASWKPCARRD